MSGCIVLRVDANPTIGLGHLMRCLGLAQGLSQSQIRVIFVISQSSAQYCLSRQDWVGEIQCLPCHTWGNEGQYLSELCIAEKADWLILDGYDFDPSYREKLNHCRFKLGIFDDGQLCQGQLIDHNIQLLINWASGAERLSYQEVVPNARLCVGHHYRVLRQEFSAVMPQAYPDRKSLLLSFGGSDPLDLTLRLLRLLDTDATTLPITVLTGAAYPHLLALNTFIKNSNLAIDHQHDCQDVAQLMGTARLAVSAAGASQFELLCCATPAVLVVLAENQQFASQQAKQQGWCKVIDYQQDDSDLGLNHILQSAHSLWGQPQVLNDMHDQARLLATQSGIEHIIGQLY